MDPHRSPRSPRIRIPYRAWNARLPQPIAAGCVVVFGLLVVGTLLAGGLRPWQLVKAVGVVVLLGVALMASRKTIEIDRAGGKLALRAFRARREFPLDGLVDIDLTRKRKTNRYRLVLVYKDRRVALTDDFFYDKAHHRDVAERIRGFLRG